MEIKVYPSKSKNGNYRAGVSIEVDGLVVKGFKLMKGSKGLFLAMPSYQSEEGEYIDTAYFLNKEAREKAQSKALKIYKKLIEDEEENSKKSNKSKKRDEEDEEEEEDIPF